MPTVGSLEISEEKLAIIHDNLTNIAKTVNDQIDEQNHNIENKQDKTDEIIKNNIIDKTKTILRPDERKRFLEISKIFVKEWIDQIRKFKENEQKKGLLSGAISAAKKLAKKPFELLSGLFGKKKKKPKEKSNLPWWAQLLKFLAMAGMLYVVFETYIKQIPDKVWEALKGIGQGIWDMFLGWLGDIWDWICEKAVSAWEWVKEKLALEKIEKFITDSWNTMTGWTKRIWGKIKTAFTKAKNFLLELPGKIWDWISDGVVTFLKPIFEAIKETWDSTVGAITDAWDSVCETADEVWTKTTEAWDSMCSFFNNIWNWVTENFSFSKVWGGIKDYATEWLTDFQDMAILFIKGEWKELGNKIIDTTTKNLKKIFGGIVDTVTGWFSDDEDEKKKQEEINSKVKKSETKTKVTNDVRKIVSKQDEIQLKDNLLETVKDIADRMNLFFSDKKNGFIDLADQLVKETSRSFKNLTDQLNGLKLQNVYNMDNEIEYSDSYDQSDKSVKTINNDYSKNVTDDFHITYNNVDFPSVNRAIEALNKQNEKEIKILENQNEYLTRMIGTISGLSDSLETFDGKKFDNRGSNNLFAGGVPPAVPKDISLTDALKQAQKSFFTALSD